MNSSRKKLISNLTTCMNYYGMVLVFPERKTHTIFYLAVSTKFAMQTIS